MNFKTIKTCAIFSTFLLISACGDSNPPFTGQKIGKPYQINGKTYNPSADSTYDKVGDASWYGPGFHGKRTANGEVFDQNDLTAAHPTLPMPSLVRVTNLANNKSVVVRVNDRGPFHSNRIIDLSKKAAQAIDVMSVKPVRVQFLARETDDYIASIQGKSPRIDMAEYNENYNKKMLEGEETAIASYDSGEVQNYAPVQSVESNDLDTPQRPAAKIRNPLISDAMADEGQAPAETTPEDQEKLYKQAIETPVRKKAESPKPVLEKKAAFNPPAVVKPVQLQNKPIAKTAAKSNEKSDGKFVILAGSFASQDNAKKLAGSMGNKGLAKVESVQINGKKWWKVHIGPFSGRDKAEEALGIIHKLAPDARIVRQK